MVKNDITVENARICFRNFSGKEGKFNPVGRRTFSWLIDDENLARALSDDGWNVRWLEPKEEGDNPQPILQIVVNYNNIPPKVVLITSSGKTILTEENINLLDWAEIINIDMIVRPYNWEVRGTTGVKAYLKSMYITIAEDKFEDKYRDVPVSAQKAIVSNGGDEY